MMQIKVSRQISCKDFTKDLFKNIALLGSCFNSAQSSTIDPSHVLTQVAASVEVNNMQTDTETSALSKWDDSDV